MTRFIVSVYSLPIKTFLIVSALVFAVWCFGYARASRDGKACVRWRLWNAFILLFTLTAILYLTILRREPGNTRRIIWDAFYSFEEAKHYPEYYRLILLNFLAFMPAGLSLPALLPSRWPKLLRMLLTVIAVFLLSAVIEQLQYHFAVGNTELDDIIYNTSGGFLGTFAVLAEKRVRSKESQT